MSQPVFQADGNGFQPGRRYFILEEDNRTIRQVPVVCEADFHRVAEARLFTVSS